MRLLFRTPRQLDLELATIAVLRVRIVVVIVIIIAVSLYSASQRFPNKRGEPHIMVDIYLSHRATLPLVSHRVPAQTGSFGNVDEVSKTILPEGEGVSSRLVDAYTVKNYYVYDYIVNQQGRPEKHIKVTAMREPLQR